MNIPKGLSGKKKALKNQNHKDIKKIYSLSNIPDIFLKEDSYSLEEIRKYVQIDQQAKDIGPKA